MHNSTQMQVPARFVRMYVDTLLWSTCNEHGEPFEDSHGLSDLSPCAMARIVDDCIRFWHAVESAGIDLDAEILVDVDPAERAAFHFWLTRNGHGAGFWDGDWSDDAGDRLTKLAEGFGEQWPYVGDDGLIYL